MDGAAADANESKGPAGQSGGGLQSQDIVLRPQRS